ncbi:histidine kinase N-terminal 7TM domain-containing protein [Halanaeroarchaeum sp. HSR-CO]|uniref:sensor histidine kinase n=1 Tax=Halanaeroarchaeum sp. HSR-CO TaxID=2866382 RepID=UPI00217D7384|nr:histidine kinase N-terminal 7TM domain-containing protein [Halanaeroarchaeum sp. HSR-CO]
MATLVGMLTTVYGLYYLSKFGRTLQVTTFTILATTITLWTFFAMVQLTATGFTRSFWAYKMLHFGSFTTAPAVFFYGLSMGTARRWVNWKTGTAIVLWLVPVFVWLFTDPIPVLLEDPHLVSVGSFSVIAHGNSPIYVAYLSAFYVLATIGLFYIVYQTWSNRSLSRSQAVILVPAIFAPMLLSVAQTFQLLPFETPGTIFTPVSFSVGMAGIGYAAFRYETFDTKALARSRTIEYMREGYLLAGTDGAIVDVNDSARSLLATESRLVGEGVTTVFPSIATERLDDGATVPPFEKTIESDDETRTLEVSPTNFTAGTDHRLGTLFVIRDITPRKAAQQQIESQRDDIALLDQMVRHDIRNQLQAVIGWADLLEDDGELSTAELEYVHRITENAERAVELTKSARDLANVMLDSESEYESVDLRRILLNEVETVRGSFADASVTIAGPLPDVSVIADEMLGSVFRNLLKNAIQHNDLDHPEVAVSATVDDGQVHVSIADDGPGIPDTLKEQMFSKGETGLDSNGTGIGLYLVETLVENYGGSVVVEDNEPRGSIFTVSLPRADSS